MQTIYNNDSLHFFYNFLNLRSVLMKSIIININGMNCSHCSTSVKNAITELEGIESVTVSLEEKNAKIEYDESKLDSEKIIEAIKELELEAYF